MVNCGLCKDKGGLCNNVVIIHIYLRSLYRGGLYYHCEVITMQELHT